MRLSWIPPTFSAKKLYSKATTTAMMIARIPKMIGAITINVTPNTSSPVTPFETPMPAEKFQI